MSQRHGVPIRGLMSVNNSPQFEGKFGRMFHIQDKDKAKFGATDADNVANLTALGTAMTAGFDAPFDGPDPEESGIPALYTYLGQFIDHDITFDPASSLQMQNDPDALVDFRSPAFDLDNVYGRGPDDQPPLYDGDDTFLLGDPIFGGTDPNARDLPRNNALIRRALIGDPRNDENVIIAQLHLAFLKFHNRVASALLDGEHASYWSGDPAELFWEAQRIVRWHYQWVVVRDFLPRIVAEGLIEDLLARPSGSKRTRRPGTRSRPERRFFRFDDELFMPVEFSVGAYRFGHSLVRPSYELNAWATNVRVFVEYPDPLDAGHLGGSRPLLDRLVIDWDRFLSLTRRRPQPARRLDTKLAGPLTNLPAGVAPPGEAGRSLAWLNLMRGRAMGLPSGQDVAEALGEPRLDDDDLGLDGAPAPLWYYILAEAATRGGKRRLGPVGGRIVAEVLIGLLQSDPASYLVQKPKWTPTLTSAGSSFRMKDFLTFAGVDPASRGQ